MLSILTQSLWRDEAFSVLIAEKNVFEIFKLSAQDTSSPFYYILLHYWMILFGSSEVAIRIMSLIFHLLTAVVIFFIAKKLIRVSYADVLIALTTLLNPFLLQYAFEARTYSLVTFLSITALYLITLKKNLTAGIFLGLAILSHNFAILTFFVFTIWWIFISRVKLQFFELLKLVSFPLLTLILWGSVIWTQWSKFTHDFWISKPTISTLINSFQILSSGELSYPIRPMLNLFSIILFVCAGLVWIRKEKNKDDYIVLLIFSLIFIPIIITFFFSLFFTPVYYERYLILTTPMLILFIGYSLNRLLQINLAIKFILGGFVVIYLIFLAIASIQVGLKSTKVDINLAVAKILAQARKDDVVITETALNFLETKYYIERSGQKIPLHAYAQSGEIPFYFGSVLYQPQDIIKEMPKNKRVWRIKTDGQFELLNL